MLKLIGTQLHQRVAELTVEIAGAPAAAAISTLDLASDGAGAAALEAGARSMARHLSLRAATIYSGSSEMQRDLIARHLLAGP